MRMTVAPPSPRRHGGLASCAKAYGNRTVLSGYQSPARASQLLTQGRSATHAGTRCGWVRLLTQTNCVNPRDALQLDCFSIGAPRQKLRPTRYKSARRTRQKVSFAVRKAAESAGSSVRSSSADCVCSGRTQCASTLARRKPTGSLFR